MSEVSAVRGEKHFLGHPIGLYVCALTEMWERFSFYGMKFLLVLYLTKHHLFKDGQGLDVLGSYSAMVYAMPLLGGMLADRYLGMRKAVLFGGLMLCLGHLGMAWEGDPARMVDGVLVQDTTALHVFYLSLSFIIVGVGFLKPNISTIVGRLYQPGDPMRDSGFTIFYMGINTGSFLATMTCGYLGQTYGWKYGFGLAGIGMFLGLIWFQWGQRYLYGHAEPANPEVLRERTAIGLSKEHLIYASSIASLAILWFVVQDHHIVRWVLIGGSVGFLVWLVYYMIAECNREQAHRMLVLTLLTIFTVVFWALFEQAGGSMTLFADRVMDRDVFGWTPTAAQFGSLNALFIILLAPVFAWLWIQLGKWNVEPQTPMKFALGIIFAGVGFGCLVFGAAGIGEGEKVSWLWMALAYFFHSAGELCLSPVGLSAVTKLSMPRVVGIMMGAWFLATAASEFVAAQLSKLAAIDTHASGEAMGVTEMLATYNELFTKLLYTGLIIGALIIVISPLLKKGMHGVR